MGALFSASRKCMQHPDRLPAMNQNSHHMTEKKFDVKVIKKCLIDLLKGDAS